MIGERSEVQAASRLWWDRDVFVSTETADQRCPSVFDLTGPARYLSHGPYTELPAGLWRATVLVEVCADAARRRLAVQFGVEPAFTTVELPYGVPGRHEVVVEHQLVEAGPVQIRIFLERAAFHGELRFHGAFLEQLDSPNG